MILAVLGHLFFFSNLFILHCQRQNSRSIRPLTNLFSEISQHQESTADLADTCTREKNQRNGRGCKKQNLRQQVQSLSKQEMCSHCCGGTFTKQSKA